MARDDAEAWGAPRRPFPEGGLVAQSQMAYQTAPLVTHEIRPGLFVFSGAGGTVTAVMGREAAAVIDTGYGPRVGEIRQAIAAVLPRVPVWLINTHWHFDHSDGNAAFAAAGTIIVAHVNCRARMSQDQYVASLKWAIPAAPSAAWPKLTCEDPLTIDLGSESLRLLPQKPSHTDGDIAVHLPTANALVMGDLLTTNGYPVIDESSGGSLRGMIEAIQGLLALIDDDTVVVPGHGEVADRAGVLEFLDMLQASEGRIRALVARELPAADIIAAAPTAEFEARWGRGYVTGPDFVRMVLAGMGHANTPAAEQRPVEGQDDLAYCRINAAMRLSAPRFAAAPPPAWTGQTSRPR
ncbi:MAG TPA: MBL fold metallo-hydrolase [Rhodopila sp.]|nr:MBL fold metallo-hydrolase [Rhodopila sp.]